MASKPVKEILQQSILLRQDIRNTRQAECLRELAVVPEQASQCHHANPPESLKHRASKSVLKCKPARSMSRKDPLHHNPSTISTDNCCGNSNTSVSECLSISSDSETQLQAWHSTQLYHKQDTGMSSLHSHRNVSPERERTAATLSPTLQPVAIFKDTDLYHSKYRSSFQSTDLPGVQIMVSQHRPLAKSHSQPIVLQNNYTQCHYYQICSSESGRSLHTPKPNRWQISIVHQNQELEERGDSGTFATMDRVRGGYSGESSSNSGYLDEFIHSSCTCLRCQHCQQRPLARRTRSFPLYYAPHVADSASVDTQCTGLVCNWQMLKSFDDCCSDDEDAGGKQHVWCRLVASGLTSQCKLIPAKLASVEDTHLVHQSSYVTPYGTNPLRRLQHAAVRMAAGTVTELALLVAEGKLRNGFAVIQPQIWHGASHSSISKLMRSFSSVAIAAKQLQRKLNLRKILIIDWDVNHCNSSQKAFYTDPSILYISLHRYCECTDNPESGGPNQVGFGDGEGFNINITWSANLDPPIGDVEYLAAFRTVVMPIALEFSPDVILISSEFNAVEGHPDSSGGHRVSAKCFGVLTQKLMQLARDRVVLVLESRHDLTAVYDASEFCINALLKNKITPLSDDVLKKKPCDNAVQALQKVLQIQSKYWFSARALAHTVAESWIQAERCSTDTEAAMALASLTMTAHQTSRYICEQNEPVEHDEEEFSM